MSPEFLSVEDVIEIRELQLARYGGADGLRDRGLLESALAQPQTSFGGTFAHEDLFAMAAAYLFHIVRNHAFVDGNKRTGLLSALVFLDINGISIEQGSEALYDLTMEVAQGKSDKETIGATLAQVASSP